MLRSGNTKSQTLSPSGAFFDSLQQAAKGARTCGQNHSKLRSACGIVQSRSKSRILSHRFYQRLLESFSLVFRRRSPRRDKKQWGAARREDGGEKGLRKSLEVTRALDGAAGTYTRSIKVPESKPEGNVVD